MKIWCEECEGSGELLVNDGSGLGMALNKCINCNGKGYTKHVGSLEDLELGLAIRLAFEKQSTVEIPCGDGNFDLIYQKFELLDWYREQKCGTK